MGQRYEGTLIIQTNDSYSPVGSKVLAPLNNPASADDITSGKGLYGDNGAFLNGSFVDGWPLEISTEEDMDAFATLENVGRYVKYTGAASQGGGTPQPVNPIEIGNEITTVYFNNKVEPEPEKLDWSESYKGSDLIKLDIIDNGAIYFGKTPGKEEGTYEYILTDPNGVIAWASKGVREMFGMDPNEGWAHTTISRTITVTKLNAQQDIWGAYISKDGKWTGGAKYISGQIYQVIQQGESAELKAIQY